MRIYRIEPKTGLHRPAVRENGKFVLGDPRFEGRKHLKGNQVYVASESEAVDLVLKGFSIRVETETRPSLVNRNLIVDGVRIR